MSEHVEVEANRCAIAELRGICNELDECGSKTILVVAGEALKRTKRLKHKADEQKAHLADQVAANEAAQAQIKEAFRILNNIPIEHGDEALKGKKPGLIESAQYVMGKLRDQLQATADANRLRVLEEMQSKLWDVVSPEEALFDGIDTIPHSYDGASLPEIVDGLLKHYKSVVAITNTELKNVVGSFDADHRRQLDEQIEWLTSELDAEKLNTANMIALSNDRDRLKAAYVQAEETLLAIWREMGFTSEEMRHDILVNDVHRLVEKFQEKGKAIKIAQEEISKQAQELVTVKAERDELKELVYDFQNHDEIGSKLVELWAAAGLNDPDMKPSDVLRLASVHLRAAVGERDNYKTQYGRVIIERDNAIANLDRLPDEIMHMLRGEKPLIVHERALKAAEHAVSLYQALKTERDELLAKLAAGQGDELAKARENEADLVQDLAAASKQLEDQKRDNARQAKTITEQRQRLKTVEYQLKQTRELLDAEEALTKRLKRVVALSDVFDQSEKIPF